MAQIGDIRVVLDGETDESGLVWLDAENGGLKHIRLEQCLSVPGNQGSMQAFVLEWVPVEVIRERSS